MNCLQPLIKNNLYLKKAINTKAFGYICPNGNINFITQKSAYDYAKTRILKALNCNTPYERGIIIDKKSIIADVKGNSERVILPNINLAGKTIIHGHPGICNPISDQDAIVLLLSNGKKCITINKKGEYSQLSKLPSSKLYDSLPEFLKNLIFIPASCIKTLVLLYSFKNFKKKIDERLVKKTECIKKFLQISYNMEDYYTQNLFSVWTNEFNTNQYGNTSNLPPEYRRLFDKLNQAVRFESRAYRYFWQKNAHKYGLKYETNYS